MGKPDIEAQLNEGIRKIRNIQFDFRDCAASLKHGERIPGTTINAIGALWQQRADKSSNGDWCIFLSWMGDIATPPSIHPNIGDEIDSYLNSASDSEHDDSSEDDQDEAEVILATAEAVATISQCMATAAKDTTHYSALCDKHDELLDILEASSDPKHITGPPTGSPSPPTQTSKSGEVPHPLLISILLPEPRVSNSSKPVGSRLPIKSQFLDGTGKALVLLLLKYCDKLQSGTTAHSEKVMKLNPKFAIEPPIVNSSIKGTDGKELRISAKEALHRLRIGQVFYLSLLNKQLKKDRELRWKAMVSSLRVILNPQGMSLCICYHDVLNAHWHLRPPKSIHEKC